MNIPCGSARRTQTEHVATCGRELGHKGACSFADGNGKHLWLDGYEIANLRALLDALNKADRLSPLAQMNTGDWFHTILWKLEDIHLPDNGPNVDADGLLLRFHSALNAEGFGAQRKEGNS